MDMADPVSLSLNGRRFGCSLNLFSLFLTLWITNCKLLKEDGCKPQHI